VGGNNDVITELFLPMGSLVSDIPAGDGKLVNLFLRCRASFSTCDSAEEDRSFGVGEEGQRALRTLLFSTNNMINIQYTVKKVIDFPVPNR
jgi:hypothetical protein